MLRITIGASWQVQEYIYIYILFFQILKYLNTKHPSFVIRGSALVHEPNLHSPYNKLCSIYGEETKTEVTISN